MPTSVVPLLQLNVPPLIPRVSALTELLANPGMRDFAEQAKLLQLPMSSIDLAELLAQLLTALPSTSELLPAEDSEDGAHDRYFHVQRVAGDPSIVLIRMALSARLILLREVHETPVSVAHEYVEQIDRALADLLEAVLGISHVKSVNVWHICTGLPDVGKDLAAGHDPSRYTIHPGGQHSEAQAMARWVGGHQVFAALSQGLILSFQTFGRALREGRFADVQRWTDLSISLLVGSGATFRLTSDFSVDAYANAIRPSMMPPVSPICLSGLMSWDHRYLVQVIRDMRPALRSLHDQEPARHRQITKALASVYDSHIHICERFVGERPSILTAERTEKSGPSLIEQFKSLRLKPFEVVAQAAALTPQPKIEARPAADLSCPFAAAAAAGADAGATVQSKNPKENPYEQ